MTDETVTIIAFTLHSILFALILLFVFANPKLLDNSTYTNIMYVLLSTFLYMAVTI